MPKIKHGMWGTKTYRCWSEMKARCTYKKHASYKNYGGRGISYDPKWDSFENFFQDMGLAPEKHDLDRKNNSIGYSKDNCRYVTRNTNLANKRRLRPFSGVSILKNGSIVSSITINSKRYRIGTFKTIEDAYNEYVKVFYEWYGFYPNNEVLNDN